jgi:tRNA (mo5U34)-methyltransferase
MSNTPEQATAEILAGVEQLQPWFHGIDLGHGIRTKTQSIAGEPVDHPLPTWRVIAPHLPADLTGQSVLDVGCNAGFYSVEVARRGAGPVLGVDVQRLHVRQASLVRRALGLHIEFRRMSVYDVTPRTVGQFDITLALGLVYHLKHLVLAVENLPHVTRDMLILETALYPPHPVPCGVRHGQRARELVRESRFADPRVSTHGALTVAASAEPLTRRGRANGTSL